MIKPIKDNVLLEKVKVANTSSSGIILSTDQKDEKNIGLVVAKGALVEEIEIGNQVIFESYQTKKVEYQSKEYLVIKEKDILGIIE